MYTKYIEDIIKIYDEEDKELDNCAHEDEDKIAEKYDKLLLENNKKYNVIFRYDLIDAWGMQICTVVVTKDKENNLWCIYDDNEKYDGPTADYHTIDYKKVENILKKYNDKIDDTDYPSVLDGFVSMFYIDVDGISKEIKAPNLGSWGDEIDNNVKNLLDMYDELFRVLYDVNVRTSECFKLDKDEFEDEE